MTMMRCPTAVCRTSDLHWCCHRRACNSSNMHCFLSYCHPPWVMINRPCGRIPNATAALAFRFWGAVIATGACFCDFDLWVFFVVGAVALLLAASSLLLSSFFKTDLMAATVYWSDLAWGVVVVSDSAACCMVVVTPSSLWWYFIVVLDVVAFMVDVLMEEVVVVVEGGGERSPGPHSFFSDASDLWRGGEGSSCRSRSYEWWIAMATGCATRICRDDAAAAIFLVKILIIRMRQRVVKKMSSNSV